MDYVWYCIKIVFCTELISIKHYFETNYNLIQLFYSLDLPYWFINFPWECMDNFLSGWYNFIILLINHFHHAKRTYFRTFNNKKRTETKPKCQKSHWVFECLAVQGSLVISVPLRKTIHICLCHLQPVVYKFVHNIIGLLTYIFTSC